MAAARRLRVLLQGQEIVVNRFQLEIADLAVDAEQGLFQILNVVASLTEDVFQLIGLRS